MSAMTGRAAAFGMVAGCQLRAAHDDELLGLARRCCKASNGSWEPNQHEAICVSVCSPQEVISMSGMSIPLPSPL
jgi:hypothetical protein